MGFVYFIQEGNSNYYKIGRSNIPDDRVRQLNTANRHKLEVVVTIECDNPIGLEYFLQNDIFLRYKLSYGGKEWFSIKPQELRETIFFLTRGHLKYKMLPYKPIRLFYQNRIWFTWDLNNTDIEDVLDWEL